MRRELISKPELLAIVPLSYPAIWKMSRDDLFPRGIYIGQRSMWYLDEVEKWLADRPRQRFGAEREPIDRANKIKAARAGHAARQRRVAEATVAAADAQVERNARRRQRRADARAKAKANPAEHAEAAHAT